MITMPYIIIDGDVLVPHVKRPSQFDSEASLKILDFHLGAGFHGFFASVFALVRSFRMIQ